MDLVQQAKDLVAEFESRVAWCKAEISKAVPAELLSALEQSEAGLRWAISSPLLTGFQIGSGPGGNDYRPVTHPDGSTTYHPVQHLQVTEGNPPAPSVEEEKPKRTRRTKAQKEADDEAEAAAKLAASAPDPAAAEVSAPPAAPSAPEPAAAPSAPPAVVTGPATNPFTQPAYDMSNPAVAAAVAQAAAFAAGEKYVANGPTPPPDPQFQAPPNSYNPFA